MSYIWLRQGMSLTSSHSSLKIPSEIKKTQVWLVDISLSLSTAGSGGFWTEQRQYVNNQWPAYFHSQCTQPPDHRHSDCSGQIILLLFPTYATSILFSCLTTISIGTNTDWLASVKAWLKCKHSWNAQTKTRRKRDGLPGSMSEVICSSTRFTSWSSYTNRHRERDRSIRCLVRTISDGKELLSRIFTCLLCLWHPMLPYGDSYQASCATPG